MSYFTCNITVIIIYLSVAVLFHLTKCPSSTFILLQELKAGEEMDTNFSYTRWISSRNLLHYIVPIDNNTALCTSKFKRLNRMLSVLAKIILKILFETSFISILSLWNLTQLKNKPNERRLASGDLVNIAEKHLNGTSDVPLKINAVWRITSKARHLRDK